MGLLREGRESLTKNTHILFACHPHQVPVIQVITSCERVCGKGVATHTEILVYKQTMKDTAVQRVRRG